MFIQWKFSWPGYVRSRLLEAEPKLVTLKANDLLREASGGNIYGSKRSKMGKGKQLSKDVVLAED